YNTFTSFFVSEQTRRYYQSHGILKTVKEGETQDNWYFRVRRMEADHEINVDPDQAHQYAMTIFVNHKVFDFNGKYIGATGVGLQVTDVKRIIETYHTKFDRIVYFISPEGKIVLSTEKDDGKDIKDLPGLSSVATQILDAGASSSLEYKVDGKTFYANSRYIPELNWILVVSKSDEYALRNILHSLLLNLILCGLITIIVIGLVYFIVNSYRHKLKEMLSTELDLKVRNDEQQSEIDKQHRKLLEQNAELVQLNASKDKLFSIIAHDLRAPLGNMTQLAALASEDLAAGRSKEALEYLTDQRELSESTLKLLDNLFDWARSRMSEASCVAADFLLRDCLEECLPGTRLQARQKNIKL
ncbi:MAG: sensor histidine kinase, partial [Synergistales bacterium]|nr:sensor histidine kinase [Synergistales bacterium]